MSHIPEIDCRNDENEETLAKFPFGRKDLRKVGRGIH